jgi:hypothetical protein
MTGKKLSKAEISKFTDAFGEGECIKQPHSPTEGVWVYTLEEYGFHRIDGPAVINMAGSQYYFMGDMCLNKVDHTVKMREAYRQLKKDKIKLLKLK